jgi:predicted acyl esterase
VKQGPRDIDESTDTYDTIEWLLKNIQNHSGRARDDRYFTAGFHVAAGMIDAHPALRAVSPRRRPQTSTSVTMFTTIGAFMLSGLTSIFMDSSCHGKVRQPSPVRAAPRDFDMSDAYNFFLESGSADRVEPEVLWRTGHATGRR